MVRWLVVVGVVAAALAGGAGVAGTEGDRRGGCERGELCVWVREGYRGGVRRVSLATVNAGECVPLPVAGRSFANRMSRAVTVYQGAVCETEAEFDTYPGGGTYVPEAPFVVHAVQIWEG
ncbi:MAG TPA: peptidase inhibitor family I36 protein [Actinophytocola sp.]|uniref:peptidase inhibitor family I36 protein n=1 Tax=Actinophytocola sp. TaxID=1872138 RepID=UPI002DDD08B9|nr:peptidase inhibitor family I36 protein [Actinophytocola sp.]HEV2781888.1 peptidase inhibitor family I36 protein [Actinophytocola sp.]